MKKQWFVGLAAILAMGCFAGCDTEANGSSGKETSGITSNSGTASTQVTEEEWKAAWEYDTSKGIAVETSFSINDIEQGKTIGKRKNNRVYNKKMYNDGDSVTRYMTFDDENLVICNYKSLASFFSDFADEIIEELGEEWGKRSTQFDNLEDYNGEKKEEVQYFLFNGAEMLFSVSKETYEEVSLLSLYSQFQYNATDKSYSANLYWDDGEEADIPLMEIIVKFENGKIVEASLKGENVNDIPGITLQTMKATYGIEDIVIPQEVLNAPEV